jgi:hypothetical protein
MLFRFVIKACRTGAEPQVYRLCLIPATSWCVPELLERFRALSAKPVNIVLWLDDLDRFLHKGLTNNLIQVAIDEAGLKIVGTMSRKRLGELQRSERGISRDAKMILGRAVHVQLDARMSEKEKGLASQFYPNRLFDGGIGESLIAGEELKNRFETADPMRGPFQVVARFPGSTGPQNNYAHTNANPRKRESI